MLSTQPSVSPDAFLWQNQQVKDASPDITTHDTRTDLSNTYAESSKGILVDKLLASDKRSQLRSGLKSSRLTYPSLFERYLDNKAADSMKLFEELNAEHQFYTIDRWKAMPENPSNEQEIARGFFSIADKVSTTLGHSDTDLFKAHLFDTHLNHIPDNHGNSHLQPDVFVQGFGRHFPVVLHSEFSAPPWAVCLTIGDFKLGVSKNKEQYFSQLATYAEQLLSAQDNRRFVEAFCMDEKYLVFLIFDRGGYVTSDQVDFQRDPWKLIALIQYLLLGKNRCQASDAGLDESVYYENGQTYIQTPSRHPPTKQDTWLLLKTLFRATDLRGPGTIFWLVQDANNNEIGKKIRLIKDEWVVGGCQYEQDLHQLAGSLPGVAPLEISYNVKSGNQLDTVRENRPKTSRSDTALLLQDDRVHTRTIYVAEAGAKTIEMFSNVVELLEGLYDAIRGHRELYRKGILHTELSPQKILLQPNASDGQRGVLIDLYDAYRLGESTIKLHKKSNVQAFASRNTLQKLRPPEYLDGLESLFFVFCYLTTVYDAQGSHFKQTAETPASLRTIGRWMHPDGGPTQKKTQFHCLTCPYIAHDSFGPAVQSLIDNWWSILSENAVKIFSRKDVTITPRAEDTYDRILGYVKKSLTALYGMEVQPPSRGGLGKRARRDVCLEGKTKKSRKD